MHGKAGNTRQMRVAGGDHVQNIKHRPAGRSGLWWAAWCYLFWEHYGMEPKDFAWQLQLSNVERMMVLKVSSFIGLRWYSVLAAWTAHCKVSKTAANLHGSFIFALCWSKRLSALSLWGNSTKCKQVLCPCVMPGKIRACPIITEWLVLMTVWFSKRAL